MISSKPSSSTKYGSILFRCGLLCLLSQLSSAATVYSNFGPGAGYTSTAGNGVGGPTSQFGSLETAMAFSVVGGSYYLTAIDIAFRRMNGPSQAGLTIRADAAGQPGAILEQVSFIPTDSFDETVNVILSGLTEISSGSLYWLAISMPADGEGIWCYPEPQATGSIAKSIDGGVTWTSPNQNVSAFSVSGVAVPEPTGFSLLVCGAACSFYLRRRNESVFPTTPNPEARAPMVPGIRS